MKITELENETQNTTNHLLGIRASREVLYGKKINGLNQNSEALVFPVGDFELNRMPTNYLLLLQ